VFSLSTPNRDAFIVLSSCCCLIQTSSHVAGHRTTPAPRQERSLRCGLPPRMLASSINDNPRLILVIFATLLRDLLRPRLPRVLVEDVLHWLARHSLPWTVIPQPRPLQQPAIRLWVAAAAVSCMTTVLHMYTVHLDRPTGILEIRSLRTFAPLIRHAISELAVLQKSCKSICILTL
jgi:hypothetical protein